MADLKQRIQTLWKKLALPAKLVLLALVLVSLFLIGRSCRNVDPRIQVLEGEKIILKHQLEENEKAYDAARKKAGETIAELQGHIDSANTEIARLDEEAELSRKGREGLEEELKFVQGDLGKENKILRELYDRAKIELDLSVKARAEDAKIIFDLKQQFDTEQVLRLKIEKNYGDLKELYRTSEDQSRLKDVKIVQLKMKNTLSLGANGLFIAGMAYLAFKK